MTGYRVFNEVIKRIYNTLNMDVKIIIYNELFEKHLKQNWKNEFIMVLLY